MGIGWFCSAIRIAGSIFPVSSALVQLQAEVDSAEFERRLAAFEDPISQIHPKISELSELIYKQLHNANVIYPRIELDTNQYTYYRKPLAATEAAGLITGSHAIGKQFVNGFQIADPTFVLYMQAKFGKSHFMGELQSKLEETLRGDRLSGHALNQQLDIPLPVVHAMFILYESKGYGICSREVGASHYIAGA